MKNYKANYILILTLLSNIAMAQESKLNFSVTAGVTWRSPTMNIFNFRGVRQTDFQTSYVDEKNIQGISYNPGIRVNYANIGFEYYPNLRYDVVSSDSRIPAMEDRYIKEFIVDHNFNFIIRKKVGYGLGASIVNAGKAISYNVNNIPHNPKIQFATINSFVAIPIKDFLDLEIKVHFIPNGYHGYDSVQTLLYTIRAYKEFGSIFGKRKS